MLERNTNWVPLIHTPTENRTCTPGMCPDQESNQQHFALWDDAQPIESHQSGQSYFFNPLSFLGGTKGMG